MRLFKKRCGCCGTKEGELHEPGCDMERCPFCGSQLITCDCCYKELKLIDKKKFPKTEGLEPKIYNNGLNEQQQEKWEVLLTKKGLIPYINMPNVCAKCGVLWPELFNADDWNKVIPNYLQKEILCYKCYLKIKGMVLECKEKQKE